MVWLAEGHLRQAIASARRPLIDHVLSTSRTTGNLHYEGRACWLMSECLATEVPASAEDHVETAMRIFERVGAQNDLAKAMTHTSGFASTRRRSHCSASATETSVGYFSGAQHPRPTPTGPGRHLRHLNEGVQSSSSGADSDPSSLSGVRNVV